MKDLEIKESQSVGTNYILTDEDIGEIESLEHHKEINNMILEKFDHINEDELIVSYVDKEHLEEAIEHIKNPENHPSNDPIVKHG